MPRLGQLFQFHNALHSALLLGISCQDSCGTHPPQWGNGKCAVHFLGLLLWYVQIPIEKTQWRPETANRCWEPRRPPFLVKFPEGVEGGGGERRRDIPALLKAGFTGAFSEIACTFAPVVKRILIEL